MLKMLLLAVAMASQAPAAELPRYWIDSTNHPGWQAFGRINGNGWAEDIVEWRRKGETATIPVSSAVRNFGVKLYPASSMGEPVRSNDPEFAASIEAELAGSFTTSDASCPPSPGPCPRPTPRPAPEPAPFIDLKPVTLSPNAVAGGCIAIGLIVLVLFGLAVNPRPKGPDAPQ